MGLQSQSVHRAREKCNARTRVHAQRGIALIMVLWLTVMLTVIAASFAYGMRNEALAARNTVSWAQARALADGAVYRTVFELLRPKVSPDVWAADGTLHAGTPTVRASLSSATDESGKIDINVASDDLLRGLLKTAGGLDDATAASLVDAIGDWKDADDLRRPNGAEAADYKAAGSPYVPANAPFETLPELQRVLGMTPALYAKVADSLTVHSRQAGINPAVRVAHNAARAYPERPRRSSTTTSPQRTEALATKLPPPPFPLSGFAAGAINLWRIRAEVTMARRRHIRARGGASDRRPATVADGAGMAGWQRARVLDAAARRTNVDARADGTARFNSVRAAPARSGLSPRTAALLALVDGRARAAGAGGARAARCSAGARAR